MTWREEVIGDCRLICGDCREILPTLGKVDAVVTPAKSVYNAAHDEAASGQSATPTRGNSGVGGQAPRDRAAVCERGLVAGATGEALRTLAGGDAEGASSDGHSLEVPRTVRRTQWPLQGRDDQHDLSDDDREGSMREMRGDNEPLHPSQGRRSYEQRPYESGSALHVVPQSDAQNGLVALKGWVLVTDPPYGIGENARKVRGRGRSSIRVRRNTITDYGDFDWDQAPASTDLIESYRKITEWQIIFGGNFFELPPTSCWLVWDKLNTGDFADCELAWTNLPKAVRRIQYHWNGYMRAERDILREHPTQKPIGVMTWAIGHVPPPTDLILDPFMGSGTTGVACVKLGRKFIGIEIEPKYFDIACRRISDETSRPRLPLEEPRVPQQETWLDMWSRPFDWAHHDKDSPAPR